MKDSSSPEAPDSSTAGRVQAGFRAHLQGIGLHDLVMLQNLVRASGVFMVLSGDRTGSLHFARGQLLHAETGELTGDAAALEILSWREGEFINSERAVPEKTTVVASLDALLLRLASEVDERRPSEPPLTTATGVRRRMDGPLSFRTTHQGLGMPGVASPALQPAPSPLEPVAAPLQPPASTPPSAIPLTALQPPASAQRTLAAAATPGVAAVAPKTPTRANEPRGGVTNVLVAPHGALIDGNGAEAEALASKVAYMTRLTELVGQSMGAGDARSIRVRMPGSELVVRRYTDGHVSASLGPVDPSADAPPPSSPLPPPARFT